ncbi:hypothetical protein AX17_006540 [Amanita inopinata Kibby_2008]|nr:hypothetical protein AX17_006540 [Amanita inopinata Kibby_2008]
MPERRENLHRGHGTQNVFDRRRRRTESWKGMFDVIANLVPVSFAQPASKAITIVLDRSQAINDNRDRFHDLQRQTLASIQLVRQISIAEHEKRPSPEVKAALANAEKSLLAISERLNSWNRWKTLPKEFMETVEYQEFFAKSQRELESVQIRLPLDTALALRTNMAKLEERIYGIERIYADKKELFGTWAEHTDGNVFYPNQAIQSSDSDACVDNQGSTFLISLCWICFYCMTFIITAAPIFHWASSNARSFVKVRQHKEVMDSGTAVQITDVTAMHVMARVSFPVERLPAAPEHFFGRDEIMEDMISNITRAVSEQRPQNIALTGSVGIGKTTIARMFINLVQIYRTFGDSRHWISCQTAPNVHAMLSALADSLSLKTRSNDPLNDVVSHLRFHPSSLLIVFDGLETPDDVEEVKLLEGALGKIRQFAQVHILLTTRDLPLPQGVHWLHFLIGPLPLNAAIDTYKAISPYHDDKIKDLVCALGCVPFAVVVMARQGQLGLYPAEILERWPIGQDPNLSPIDNVVRMSLDSKRFASNPEAIILLTILSKLPKGAQFSSLAKIAPTIDDPFKAVSTLLASSLVSREPDGSLQMLAPTRSYILRNKVLELHQERALRAYYFQLCANAGHDVGTEDFKKASIKAIAVLENGPQFDEERLLLSRCLFLLGKLLYRMDRYHESEAALTRTEESFKAVGDWHSLGWIYFLYAQMKRLLGITSEAAGLYIKAREYFEMSGNSVGVSDSLRGLAILAFNRGDFQKAVRLLDHARQRCMGYEPCAVATAFGLGWILRQDDSAYAIELLQGARKAYVDYGTRNPVAICTYQIGIAHYFLGNHDAAFQSLLVAYQEFETLNNYGQMAYSLDHLVEVELARGNVEEALQYNGEMRIIFEKIENQQEVANSFIIRGRIFAKACQLDDARQAYESAMTISSQKCNDAATLHLIGVEMKNLNRICRPVWRRMLLPW